MMDCRFVPLKLEDYSGARKSPRKASQFKAGWLKTVDLLEYELKQLGAKDIVIQAGFDLSQLRNDGWVRPQMKPSHPAVIVSFIDRDKHPLSFPCDTYNGFVSNLRAIALSLEALRAVNRYGVTTRGEQYTGFARIEASPWTVESAADWLATVSGLTARSILTDKQAYMRAFRDAAKRFHPDASGVENEQWHALQRVQSLIEPLFVESSARPS